MGSYVKDYILGTESEKKIKETLETFYEDSFTKLPRYHPADYEGGKRFLEIKTRRCKKQSFPTTMLPYNKIEFAKKTEKPTTFIFVFEDGIYTIDFDSVKFETFNVSLFKRRTRYDYNDKEENYCFIPIEELQQLQMK